jgi:hypothetical protein
MNTEQSKPFVELTQADIERLMHEEEKKKEEKPKPVYIIPGPGGSTF